MKIALLEPLRVSQDFIDCLAQPLIAEGHEFVAYPDKTTDPEELYRRSKDADIIIIANNPFPKAVLERLDKTQLIDIAFTGVDHVDVALASEKGIKVANASGYAESAVAELILGLNLVLYRQILQSDRDTRAGQAFPGLIQGREIAGKTVGIVGTGSIGYKVAQLYQAFGAKLVGYNRSEKAAFKDLGLTYLSLEDVAQTADIITLHLPLTSETRHLINANFLDRMKRDAIIINVARGPIVDNVALAAALKAEKIAGAGIDVYDMEAPLPDDYPLLKAPNTVLTPHVGYLTDEAMEARAQIVFDNIHHFLQGQGQNLVN